MKNWTKKVKPASDKKQYALDVWRKISWENNILSTYFFAIDLNESGVP